MQLTDEQIEKARKGMKSWGGSFVQRLAVLWLYADEENRQKLLNTFEHYFRKYADMEYNEEEAR